MLSIFSNPFRVPESLFGSFVFLVSNSIWVPDIRMGFSVFDFLKFCSSSCARLASIAISVEIFGGSFMSFKTKFSMPFYTHSYDYSLILREVI